MEKLDLWRYNLWYLRFSRCDFDGSYNGGLNVRFLPLIACIYDSPDVVIIVPWKMFYVTKGKQLWHNDVIITFAPKSIIHSVACHQYTSGSTFKYRYLQHMTCGRCENLWTWNAWPRPLTVGTIGIAEYSLGHRMFGGTRTNGRWTWMGVQRTVLTRVDRPLQVLFSEQGPHIWLHYLGVWTAK
jgi:hypothetical protein